MEETRENKGKKDKERKEEIIGEEKIARPKKDEKKEKMDEKEEGKKGM